MAKRAECSIPFFRGESGSALVEIAVASAVLFTMMFGIIQFSLAHYVYLYLPYVAREATRYAIVRGSSCTSFGSACPASATDIQNYVESLKYPVIDASLITVTTTWPTTGPTCTPSINPCNNPGNLVQVTVTFSYPLWIPFLPTKTLNMTASSQMVISQ
jgi:Flp pilus assembly protein TadG